MSSTSSEVAVKGASGRTLPDCQKKSSQIYLRCGCMPFANHGIKPDIIGKKFEIDFAWAQSII
jgi:hypothetical protein